MPSEKTITSVERIERLILLIRGQRVMLDADLARLYGVSTKALNQAVKRNETRFPSDFMFQLTPEELTILRSQIVTSRSGPSRSQTVTGSHGGRRYPPHVFTEHGAIMLANVLNSDRAVQASVQVVRAFVRLRQMLASNRALADKLGELERRIATHDERIQAIFEAIRQLLAPPSPPLKQIGFQVKERKGRYAVAAPNA